MTTPTPAADRVDNASIYSNAEICKTIQLPISAVDRQLKSTIERVLSDMMDGTCIVEGYVKPNTISVLHYSCGVVHGNMVTFDVAFACKVCFPVAGMLIRCVTLSVTKAGIRATSAEDEISPVEVFVLRDYSYNNEEFNGIQAGDLFTARVISQRFELTNTQISVIAQIAPGSVHRP